MGGEKFWNGRGDHQSVGSPPRGRGKAERKQRPHRDHEDHPRVGGEKRPAGCPDHCHCGSPPRGRGKARFTSFQTACLGITPAWAGKSLAGVVFRPRKPDHPRVGGEKQTSTPETGRPLGSPPRGRGKAGSGSVQSYRPGITPAWAGKSYSWRAAAAPKGDHPRVGGEKALSSALAASV